MESFKRDRAGFTLVELIAVLVILGLLGAIAVPRYLDLSDDAAANAIASNLSSYAGSRFVEDLLEKDGDMGAMKDGTIDWSAPCGDNGLNQATINGENVEKLYGLRKGAPSFSINASEGHTGFAVPGVDGNGDQATHTCYVDLDGNTIDP